MLSRIYSFLFGKRPVSVPVKREYVGLVESNGTYDFDWLPGCEIKGVASYHVWGTAKAGCSGVGESDFIDGGVGMTVTEITVGLFGSSIPLTLSAVDSATRGRIEAHVREMVGEDKLAAMLWASVETH